MKNKGKQLKSRLNAKIEDKYFIMWRKQAQVNEITAPEKLMTDKLFVSNTTRKCFMALYSYRTERLLKDNL